MINQEAGRPGGDAMIHQLEKQSAIDQAYNAPRDAAGQLIYLHPVLTLARYSQGVHDFVLAGKCEWLLDILVEPIKIFREASDFGHCARAEIGVSCRNGSAAIDLDHGSGSAWRFRTYATLPDGSWKFIMVRGDPATGRDNLVCLLLPSEI